jgi:GxxExxY protein
MYELTKRALKSERQVPLPVYYDCLKMEVSFRADMIVENKVIVELKSIELVAPVHKKKLLTYLNLANLQIGLFN